MPQTHRDNPQTQSLPHSPHNRCCKAVTVLSAHPRKEDNVAQWPSPPCNWTALVPITPKEAPHMFSHKASGTPQALTVQMPDHYKQGRHHSHARRPAFPGTQHTPSLAHNTQASSCRCIPCTPRISTTNVPTVPTATMVAAKSRALELHSQLTHNVALAQLPTACGDMHSTSNTQLCCRALVRDRLSTGRGPPAVAVTAGRRGAPC